MSTHHENVEFKTLDGLTLRGWLYPVSGRGPAIVITPGFNCVKEMFVPEVAEQFQLAGITALIYDPRTLGLSDGLPRNDINPAKQAEDYSDALSFLSTLPMVDPERIALWGMSFSATIALCAGALDKRAKVVIAICPWLTFEYTKEKFPKVLAKSMKDRESQLQGNSPFYLPVLTDKGQNPAGLGIGADKEGIEYMINTKERGVPNHENRTTLQTCYKLVVWQPRGVMRYMGTTPVMMIVPELDLVSPPEEQIALFDTFPGPKKLHIAAGKGHVNVLSGDEFPVLQRLQADYLKAVLGGKL